MHLSGHTLHESDLRLLVQYQVLRTGVAQGLATGEDLVRFRRKNEDHLNRVALVLRNMRAHRRRMVAQLVREMN